MLSHRPARLIATLALLASLGAPAQAEGSDQVVAPMKGVSSLSVYAKPYDSKAQGSVALKDVSFPLPVVEADGDFLKVRLAGKDQWIDGAQVQVSKSVAFHCVKGERKTTRVASTQGASTGCQ